MAASMVLWMMLLDISSTMTYSSMSTPISCSNAFTERISALTSSETSMPSSSTMFSICVIVLICGLTSSVT